MKEYAYFYSKINLSPGQFHQKKDRLPGFTTGINASKIIIFIHFFNFQAKESSALALSSLCIGNPNFSFRDQIIETLFKASKVSLSWITKRIFYYFLF